MHKICVIYIGNIVVFRNFSCRCKAFYSIIKLLLNVTLTCPEFLHGFINLLTASYIT